MAGAFGDCAFLLTLLNGTVEGDTFWIESTTGHVSAEEVLAADARGAIHQVN